MAIGAGRAGQSGYPGVGYRVMQTIITGRNVLAVCEICGVTSSEADCNNTTQRCEEFYDNHRMCFLLWAVTKVMPPSCKDLDLLAEDVSTRMSYRSVVV